MFLTTNVKQIKLNRKQSQNKKQNNNTTKNNKITEKKQNNKKNFRIHNTNSNNKQLPIVVHLLLDQCLKQAMSNRLTNGKCCTKTHSIQRHRLLSLVAALLFVVEPFLRLTQATSMEPKNVAIEI